MEASSLYSHEFVLVAHRQLEAALEGIFIVFALQILQDLQDLDHRFQFGRKFNLRRGEIRIAAAAGILGFHPILGIPIALDGHQAVDRAQVHHQGHVIHQALPAVRHVIGKGIHVEVEAARQALGAAAGGLDVGGLVFDVNLESAAHLDQGPGCVGQAEILHLFEQLVPILNHITDLLVDLHQLEHVFPAVGQRILQELGPVAEQADRVTKGGLGIPDVGENPLGIDDAERIHEERRCFAEQLGNFIGRRAGH